MNCELFKMSDRKVSCILAGLYRDESGKVIEPMPWNISVAIGFDGDALCVPDGRCPDKDATGKDGLRYRPGNCGYCRYFMGAEIHGRLTLGDTTKGCCGALLYASKANSQHLLQQGK